MEYTTNDLSKILDVSTNTIRRFEEKGYLNAIRNTDNGYRQFDSSDVEKLMYVGKYRKVGFSHRDISELLQRDIDSAKELLAERKAQLDAQIAEYKALSHLLKDDIALIDRIREYGFDLFELESSPFHYVLYRKRGELCTGGFQGRALHRFMSTCPEFEYIYIFDWEDIRSGNITWSAGVAANQLITKKYGVDTSPPVESYERHFCLMRFVRVPLDFLNAEQMAADELKKLIFDDFADYMSEHDYMPAGDVLALKIGLSREDDQQWQYLLIHFPVDKRQK
ncbi:MAG: MerR family transcriptional regulator [Acetatifactor sp.]|nr:MerR family transcriptional regulator [Acetatifactor sp.]MDE7113702.1 MerR family transcriptional regulator [Acetatifactor sp.]